MRSTQRLPPWRPDIEHSRSAQLAKRLTYHGRGHQSCCPLTYVPDLGTGPARESPAPSRYGSRSFLCFAAVSIWDLRVELTAELLFEFRDRWIPTAIGHRCRTRSGIRSLLQSRAVAHSPDGRLGWFRSRAICVFFPRVKAIENQHHRPDAEKDGKTNADTDEEVDGDLKHERYLSNSSHGSLKAYGSLHCDVGFALVRMVATTTPDRGDGGCGGRWPAFWLTRGERGRGGPRLPPVGVARLRSLRRAG
jgi:hypothetical protein